MLEDFFRHVYITPLVLLLLFALFFIRRATNVKKLTFMDFITPALQAIVATSFLITGINLFYAWMIERIKLPTLVEPLDPTLIAGIFFIAFAMWVIYKSMKDVKRRKKG
jgi:ABC-type nickel/cobalt efflux system permease component RcnA